MTDMFPVRRALLSVFDKTGLIELATTLAGMGVELVSTGGSAKVLRDAGLEVRDVSALTGLPEMMDGRVKTLHPNVHGGLLALRDNNEHVQAMKIHRISGIDLLIVNLYPFEDTVAGGADAATCVENIDIGGPAMIRAAAKNHSFVTTIVDVEDYDALLQELADNDGQTHFVFRQKMAARAYSRTAAYDAAVSTWFASELNDMAPRRKSFAGTLSQTLRYGENPHQSAVFYKDGTDRAGVATATLHQGKELSYNNINDTDAAFELASEFDPAQGPVCAIIKHANPCGVARGDSAQSAYKAAFDCDRTSAFGGIVALNAELDAQTAAKITEIFTEVVIAPSATPEAIALFAKKPNLRLLTAGAMADPSAHVASIRQVSGGFLVQDNDAMTLDKAALKFVTKRTPGAREMEDLLFAWIVAKHVKSNAIVYVKNGMTVGIGAGQMSRVDSSRIAALKAQDMAKTLGLKTPLTEGSVVASDAFFPFSDGLMSAVEAGAKAVIQPGGSMRDDEVIAAADAAGVAMVFTGMRHFRH